jgi:hypothetical protein
MRILALLPVLALAVPCNAMAPEFAAPQKAFAYKSATKARDIDGIVLGMRVEDVAKRMALTPLGANRYSATIGKVHYLLETTPLGRIYRISSTEPLGKIVIDDAFNRKLNARLEAKYGVPANGIDGRYWDLIETVPGPDGRYRRFVSNSFAVKLVQDEQGMSLTMSVLDARYLLSDKAKVSGTAAGTTWADTSF